MRRERAVLVAALAAGAVLAWVLQYTNDDFLSMVCREDGVVECLTAIFYFVASGLFVRAGLQPGKRTLWHWGLALMFFAVAGEEISWGQRIFGVATPGALDEVNVQHELNLHNIDGIEQNVRAVGCLIVLGIAYVIPLVTRFGPRSLQSLLVKVRMPVFPLWASNIITLGLLLMIVHRAFGLDLFNLDEVGELYFSIAFLVFAVETTGAPARTVVPAMAAVRVRG